MSQLPFIGPLSPAQVKLARVREPLRMHLSWITPLVVVMALVAIGMSGMMFKGVSTAWIGIGLVAFAVALNVAVALADRAWPPVSALGIRGLSMMDEWLRLHEEWVDPVARWLDACGDLDSRHFMCLRRLVEGPDARPLGPANAHWAIRHKYRDATCENPYDLAGGKIRQQVLWLQNEKERNAIHHGTPPSCGTSRPRRL